MNWLDAVLGVLVLATTVWGIVRGLVRQVVGLVAVVAGLILAAFNYRSAAAVLLRFVDNEVLANFLGFVAVFVAVLAAGGLVGWLFTKAMKGPLDLANRLFGGAFGMLKGVLICGILVFALLAFGVGRPAIEGSRLAPLCFGLTRAAVNLIPQDLKERFDSSYQEIRKSGGKDGQKI